MTKFFFMTKLFVMTKFFSRDKTFYKKSCDLNCQVFVNAGTNVMPQSVCLACKHLAAFHEQVPVKSEQITANNDTKNSSSKPLQSTITERSLTSPTNTGGNGTFGKAKSFTEWLKDKRSDEFRQTKQTKKRKINSKGRENNDELVTINIGLMESKSNQLKKVWGKRLPIKIQKCSTYSSILETERLKWSAYYSNLMQDKEYVLLYKDGNQALFTVRIPVQTFQYCLCIYLANNIDYIFNITQTSTNHTDTPDVSCLFIHANL